MSHRWWYPLFLCVLVACAPGIRQDPVPAREADAGTRIVEDVVYGHKFGMALTLDVYQPPNSNGAGIVFLNSGGYVSPVFSFVIADGDSKRLRTEEEMRGALQFNVRRLVENGYTVFNVRHGSSPKFLLPEILDDVRLAIRAVRARAAEYGVDPDRIGVWGGSAGGHLALMLGTTPEIGPSAREAPPAVEAPVAAVVAYYPPTELVSERATAEAWAQANHGTSLVNVFPAIGFPEELDPELSPANHATPDDPPILIVHGDADDLVPLEQGRIMHEALQAAGVSSELVVIEGAGHGFGDEDAELALERALDWFDRHLR